MPLLSPQVQFLKARKRDKYKKLPYIQPLVHHGQYCLPILAAALRVFHLRSFASSLTFLLEMLRLYVGTSACQRDALSLNHGPSLDKLT